MLKLSGGAIYDPANGVDGVVGDVWIDGGKVVNAPTNGKATRTIDARGLVVMPGGVDPHTHIVGPKINAARQLCPPLTGPAAAAPREGGRRSGSLGIVPSSFTTGYRYAALGYTTVMDAAVPPLAAREAHQQLADTPGIDKGFFALVGNNHYLMSVLAAKRPDQATAFLGWLLGRTGAYAPKLVNPGGVEAWKQGRGGWAFDIDEPAPTFGVTSREIIQAIATGAAELGLPHPIHIHANALGLPGNYRTTLATMETLGDLRGHLAHVQFHSYGGDDEHGVTSESARLVDYVNAHPNLSVDVGQVLFGDTATLTGDGALGYFLQRLTGSRWISADAECEAGCGVAPFAYKEKNVIHALQWAIGLEWFLLIKNPWQLALSTDHPNGGSFLQYPHLIALLMDRELRRETLARLPKKALRRTCLPDLEREYTLGEIAIITRAAPARILGLAQKGHLGVGADGDVTLYQPDSDRRRMFATPRYVVKGGEIVVDDGELRATPAGETLSVAPAYDASALADLPKWFGEHYSIEFAQYGA